MRRLKRSREAIPWRKAQQKPRNERRKNQILNPAPNRKAGQTQSSPNLTSRCFQPDSLLVELRDGSGEILEPLPKFSLPKRKYSASSSISQRALPASQCLFPTCWEPPEHSLSSPYSRKARQLSPSGYSRFYRSGGSFPRSACASRQQQKRTLGPRASPTPPWMRRSTPENSNGPKGATLRRNKRQKRHAAIDTAVYLWVLFIYS